MRVTLFRERDFLSKSLRKILSIGSVASILMSYLAIAWRDHSWTSLAFSSLKTTQLLYESGESDGSLKSAQVFIHFLDVRAANAPAFCSLSFLLSLSLDLLADLIDKHSLFF